jgi:hypothetical protein
VGSQVLVAGHFTVPATTAAVGRRCYRHPPDTRVAQEDLTAITKKDPGRGLFLFESLFVLVLLAGVLITALLSALTGLLRLLAGILLAGVLLTTLLVLLVLILIAHLSVLSKHR